MVARIYSPSKSAMQSGKGSNKWVLEYNPTEANIIEPFMGYTSNSDMKRQIKLKFNSLELATAYAERENLLYVVEKKHYAKEMNQSYGDNFAFSRVTPWTH